MSKQTVWKFEIPHLRNALIEMPVDAKVLHVDIQDEKLFIWALVDPQAPMESRPFTFVATGDALEFGNPGPYAYSLESGYVATVKYMAMVYHVFQGQH